MQLNESQALALIHKAIEAGVIKFNGSGANEDHSKMNAERDAMYLLTVLTKLQGQTK